MAGGYLRSVGSFGDDRITLEQLSKMLLGVNSFKYNALKLVSSGNFTQTEFIDINTEPKDDKSNRLVQMNLSSKCGYTHSIELDDRTTLVIGDRTINLRHIYLEM